MTFTYKLAQRLARLKHRAAIVATVVAAMIVGCELPIRTTDTGSIITQLVVAPKNVTLQPNQAYDFVAVGFTATGDSADESVSWSASDGSITSTTSGKRHYGHFHNANCGVSKVAATSNPGNRVGHGYRHGLRLHGAGGLGEREPRIRHGGGRTVGPAHGHAEGRERHPALGSDGHVVEQ